MACETHKKPLSCAQMLNEALNAYHQLMAGVVRVTVQHGDSSVTYQQRNVAALKEYIRSLHQACGNKLSAAVIGIPTNRRPGVPVFGRTQLMDPGCGCNTPAPCPTKDCDEC